VQLRAATSKQAAKSSCIVGGPPACTRTPSFLAPLLVMMLSSATNCEACIGAAACRAALAAAVACSPDKFVAAAEL
jgi:hypothetical protein